MSYLRIGALPQPRNLGCFSRCKLEASDLPKKLNGTKVCDRAKSLHALQYTKLSPIEGVPGFGMVIVNWWSMIEECQRDDSIMIQKIGDTSHSSSGVGGPALRIAPL
jgi:hypothetical protein